jgi:hypothetical protein
MKLGKKWLIIALAVVILGGVAVGAALAEADSQAAGSPGQVFLDKLTAVLGIDRAKLDDAMKTAGNQTVDQLLQEGKISQQQADQLRSRISQGFPFFGMGMGPGKKGAAGRMLPLKSLADTLGMTPQDLLSALRSGKTVADLATSKGMTMAQVQDKVLAAVKAQLDQAVSQGKLTQDQEQQIMTRMQQSITSGNWINQLQKGCIARGKQQPGGQGQQAAPGTTR